MMEIKTLFISDVHLGSQHAQTEALIDFLTKVKKHPPEKIFIVGDFIDGWKLQRNWYWTDQSNLVIRKILGFVKRGTLVHYIAGNHDDFLRSFMSEFDDLDFGSITISDEFVHETTNGKRLLVVHGDKFDLVTKYAKWLCIMGDIGYEILLKMNTVVHAIRRALGLPYWSMSKAIKHKVKQAVNYVSDFECFLTEYCEQMGCDGVVCGHIHTAALKEVNGWIYCNTGDWVESCSAIIEKYDGSLELYYHHEETV